ncbi:putative mRNA 3-end processing factor [Filomicrobium insigne]|uniref:mRNA 3-end processing factor n=1 Tax=Filomicrobium insigne TaxID=418854 RepID=A0A1H0LYX7_9HYPH|nr:ligase-associated DNA damage response exonuclease [Filomicrobium insigne]SDO73293.1 putative mRNA 3-end processing factor [Filomicrobium insigne]
MTHSAHIAERWLYPTDAGLYCEPGDFFIDPHLPTPRAVITHGHADHARAGHDAVLTTSETAAIMRLRYGPDAVGRFETVAYGETHRINGLDLKLVPAGHILGSAQVVLEYQGSRIAISGDYKRSPDPTCEAFEPINCDVFVTEATFALPVFRHEVAQKEIQRLLASLRLEPDRPHLVGVYGLGKCQRVIKLLREEGYDDPIWLHGALISLCDLYKDLGHDLGDLRVVDTEKPGGTAQGIIMCPPSALGDRWSRRFPDSVSAFASGWMRIRARARQRGVELPLVISDHADWPELIGTIRETGAAEIWVTHGRDDALVHQLSQMGVKAKALALVGFEDEAE